MKDAKVTIFKEKIILQRLKRLLLNFRLKSQNGNEKDRDHKKSMHLLKKEKNSEKLSLNTFTTTINLLLFMKKK